ncbi:MAG: VanZ family protein [Flavobacteriaceae bacterium]
MAFLGWVIAITALSLVSFSSLDTGQIDIPYADKITHFTFYFVFALLACLFLRERTGGKIKLSTALTISVLLAIGYGIFIEVLQYTITEDRMAEFGDILANTIGAFLGIALIKWCFSKERPLKWKI